jgi:ribonuclease G
LPLNWFRRKASDKKAPSSAAVEVPLVEPPTVEEPASEAPAGQPSPTDPNAPKTRRRGTRGGRNRKKKPVDAAGAALLVESAPRESKAPERKPPEKKATERKPRERSSQPARRRQPPRRAPLPKAKRELLISVDAGEKRVAVLEDDKVAEVYLERPERRSIAGNVYLGVVDNVLPGMEAAFVEIGLEKNGFLFVDEIVGPELEGRKGARKIQDLIQRGENVLVQAVKDPMKTKGARLTTEISLPGRFVVYVPHGEGLGVSRRLEDDERNRLKAILKEYMPKKGGVIVRTAAEGASADDIERDLDFLQRLWRSIEAKAKESTAPSLIYQEAELPLRVVRDLFTGDFERLLVDHDRTYKRIVGYLKKTSPHMAERVSRYKEREPLMEVFGVEQEIKSTLSRRVDLPSGGYLIFDYAEAFTVIDVNTGRYVGSRSRKSGARLEDTITKNNLEAVKEVVRQLRLRDVGGIIVIDFIDMASPKNRAAVEEALGAELERDRTKTYVVEISPLGLVEMTRQNVTDGPREIMTKKCPTCGGDGIVISEYTAAVDIERRLRMLPTPGSRSKAFKVEVAARVASLLAGPGASRLLELEEATKRVFFLVGKEGEHLDHFRVLEQGTLEKVAPKLPVAVGQEIELKLGELGLYDAQAGVGKVGDIEIVVGDAAKLIGKKVKARITAITEGMAWAELLTPVTPPADPLTAEAEAEKPTRAKRTSTRKAADSTDSVAGDLVGEDEESDVRDDVELAEPDGDAPQAVDGEPDVIADGDATATPAKKRTRRGTRGGRNRKKPAGAAAGAASANGGEAADGGEPAALAEPAAAAMADLEPDDSAVEPGAPAGETGVSAGEPVPLESPPGAHEPHPEGPVIHLPGRELEEADDGEGPATPKKRTRRGSRGGKNRRKKPVAAGEATETEALDADVDADAEPGPDRAQEHVPEPAAERDPEPEPDAELEPEPQTDPVEPSENGSDEWAYTPMSQWGDSK